MIEGRNQDLEKSASYYDILSLSYDSTYSDPISSAENLFVQNKVKAYFEGNVLDVGCGTGLLLDLVKYNGNYFGLDLSRGMLTRAYLKHQKPFIEGDMDYLPIKSESINSIVCMFGTFSYSLQPKKLVDEFWRVLKPGGRIFVMPSSLRMKYRLMQGHSHSTTAEEEVEKMHYTTNLLKNVFDKFSNLKIVGLNYFANIIEDLNKQINESVLDEDFYLRVLNAEDDLRNIVPVEYARHIIVTGTKK